MDPDHFTEGQQTDQDWNVPDYCVLRQREDNMACITLLERGWTKLLAHVSTVYGVSALWASERIAEGRVELIHERTARICADPMTKLTDPTVLLDRNILRDMPELYIVPLTFGKGC